MSKNQVILQGETSFDCKLKFLNIFLFLQTVAERIFDYKVENSLHVRSFVWQDGFPFKMAPENYYIKAMSKRLKPAME